MRWVVCGLVWIGAMMTSLLIASKTMIGPVVVQLSPNHGIHAGDVLAALIGVSVASLFTAVAWLTRPPRRSSAAVAAS